MISQAIALSIITFTGFYIIYSKLPEKVKTFFCRFDLLTDVLCCAAAYLLLGGTLTALMAAAVVGLMTSVALYIGNHQEDFQYLWDLVEATKITLGKIKDILKEQGIKYREGKPAEASND